MLVINGFSYVPILQGGQALEVGGGGGGGETNCGSVCNTEKSLVLALS